MNLKEIAIEAIEEAEKKDNDGYDMSELLPADEKESDGKETDQKEEK